MAIQVSYPGVYIEEFAPGAPILGLSISTPAFIGVAAGGPIDQPVKLTSWDAFRARFGAHPVAGFYLWHAVKGFFANGGQTCYVVRASNGEYSQQTIVTTTGAVALFDVRARVPGNVVIKLAVKKVHALASATTSLFRLKAATQLKNATALGDTQIVMSAADGAQLRPGDRITIAAVGEHITVLRIINDGTDATVQLAQPLTGTYSATDKVRFDDTSPGEKVFRITSTVALPADALAPGAMLTFEQAPTPAATQLVESVQKEVLSATATTYRVTLRQGLGFAVDMTKATTVESNEFDFTVQTGAGSKAYSSLVLDPAHPRYYVGLVNDDKDGAVTVIPATPTPAVAMPGIMPKDQALAAMTTAGSDEDISTMGDPEFVRAIDTLHYVTDASILACPDRINLTVRRALIDQCELLLDRFAVLDCSAGLDPLDTLTGVPNERAGLSSTRGYAAYYYPWISVPPDGAGPPILVPPSGHVCGVYARVDNARGVFKAPANENLNGALGVERVLTDIDHGLLNLSGVDVMRVFQAGGRPMVFGARTTATDLNWQYVNIRRLFIFLEKSIQQGIQWAVFEPNNLALWQKLKRSIGDFLNKQWRDGALFGAKAEDAYYVRIDEALNPFSEQQLGRLHIEIGVRPSYPAEFIIVRIGIWPGGSAVTEG